MLNHMINKLRVVAAIDVVSSVMCEDRCSSSHRIMNNQVQKITRRTEEREESNKKKVEKMGKVKNQRCSASQRGGSPSSLQIYSTVQISWDKQDITIRQFQVYKTNLFTVSN